MSQYLEFLRYLFLLWFGKVFNPNRISLDCLSNAQSFDVSVMFAYEQCLLCLAYHPDIWIEAAAYLEQSSKILTEKGVCIKLKKKKKKKNI